MTAPHASTGVARRPFSALPSLVAAAATPPARADMVVTDGVQPWDLCAGCHGLNGVSAITRFPRLAGQLAAYIIVRQVRDFASGRRTNDGVQMAAVASDIADADLAQTAASFDPAIATDTAEWRRGATRYQDRDPAAGIPQCGVCHHGDEIGQPGRPLLKAQHAAYVAKQLQNRRRVGGHADDDNAAAMATVAAKLSNPDIPALAACLASAGRMVTARGWPQ